MVLLAHLPRTHLDGAALRLADGRPVVALTLRYDRIDHFWFSLLHELAHVGRHFGAAGYEVFVDDLNLRSTQAAAGDPRELEADEWAEEALIIAGRVRYEQGNYKLLSHYVGSGEVRRHFPEM